jgi:hypothetical protein
MNETTLDLAAAARDPILRIGQRRPHPSTLYRWARRGLNGVFLEYARIGRRIVTSREALARFVAALAKADRRDAPVKSARPRPRSRSERERANAIADARRRLAAAGIDKPQTTESTGVP